jgi:hypothetical protein
MYKSGMLDKYTKRIVTTVDHYSLSYLYHTNIGGKEYKPYPMYYALDYNTVKNNYINYASLVNNSKTNNVFIERYSIKKDIYLNVIDISHPDFKNNLVYHLMNLGHLLNTNLQYTIDLMLASFGLTDDIVLQKKGLKQIDCPKLDLYDINNREPKYLHNKSYEYQIWDVTHKLLKTNTVIERISEKEIDNEIFKFLYEKIYKPMGRD